MKVKSLSRVRLFATPWTVACQAPQSMEFSRQEYWSGLPFPSPRDLTDPGIEPGSPALRADALPSEKSIVEKDTYTSVLMAALFTVARTWKQLRYSSRDEWINKVWCVYIHSHTYTHTELLLSQEKECI